MDIYKKVSEFCSLNGYDFEVKPIVPDGCDFIHSYKIKLYMGKFMCEKMLSKNCVDSSYFDVVGKTLSDMDKQFKRAIK